METLWYEVKYASLFKELERFSTTASKQVSYPAVWGLVIYERISV